MRHGAHIDPPNRFGELHAEADLEHLAWDEQWRQEQETRRIQYVPDSSRSIVTENDSPDLPFRYSVNPYRGCVHGCAYCYARQYHEYLGLRAGLDFETRIFVKEQAPQLLREFLASPRWSPETIVFSGVTDCYQPAERDYRLTRGCLEVALEARQPIGIVTKNALVLRDLDLLQEMAELHLVHVHVSLTTLDEALARVMEPRTSIPAARLRAMRALSAAGVPVGGMIAPVIPGLNDAEIPQLLEAAAGAGARSAGWILLRLPLSVEPVFRDWLARTQPLRRKRVEGLIRRTRGGRMSSAEFGIRMRGTGLLAEQIARVFKVFARKHGLDGQLPALDATRFRPPRLPSRQLRLF